MHDKADEYSRITDGGKRDSEGVKAFALNHRGFS